MVDDRADSASAKSTYFALRTGPTGSKYPIERCVYKLESYSWRISLHSDMLLSLGCNWLLVSPRVVAFYPLPPRSVDPLTKEKPFQVWPATAAPGRANYNFLH